MPESGKVKIFFIKATLASENASYNCQHKQMTAKCTVAVCPIKFQEHIMYQHK